MSFGTMPAATCHKRIGLGLMPQILNEADVILDNKTGSKRRAEARHGS